MKENLGGIKGAIEVRRVLQVLPPAHVEKSSVSMVPHKVLDLCAHISVTNVHLPIIGRCLDALLKIESCHCLLLINDRPVSPGKGILDVFKKKVRKKAFIQPLLKAARLEDRELAEIIGEALPSGFVWVKDS